MTLRHIVMWKLNGESVADRDAQATEIIEALVPLRDSVPSVRSLQVQRNELFEGANYDVVLIGDFDDADGLETYATHPEHVKVIDLVRGYSADRVAVDFTL